MAEGPAEADLLDLLIIGAGPAGIATAVEARRAGIRRILLLEKGPGHSFSIEKLYTPGKRVDKVYLGQQVDCEGAVCIVDGTRETVLEALDGFVREYGLDIRSHTEVSRITPLDGGGFEAVDAQGATYRTRTVVIAIGVYGRPNKPDYPLPASLKGNVRFDLTESLPAGASVLVVGGGNTALEYVEYLYAGHDVTLAYRGAEFARANEVNRRILRDLETSGQATVWRNADIASLGDAGAAPRVEVRFKDGRTARFDHVVYALGGATPEGFLRQAGVDLDGRHPRVDHRYHTAVPGLFLAGDLVAGGKGSIVKAFNTGRTVVWEGLCQDHLECRIPGAGEGA
ncbi:NAD(P)-binding domain-containing protein [Geothrix fermentans]|jgi:thioredoxin reductase (NADPH)|uniref:NAD(P)-binding domain-containing protein n=1 Tax=Geothrix fermentans TaxID=44676 RepID=UPI0004107C85|nr:NAD(P)-binding domain-containing protein [Geothrix fermentans]